jgi:predicted metal-dependent HD superfamily phosphohydrolase
VWPAARPTGIVATTVADIESWRRLWDELGAAHPDPELCAELLARYREPHRKYHTLRHLDECLAELAPVRGLAERSAEVELALWFHDAIYDVRRSDNEDRSAEWAGFAVLAAGAPREVAARVRELVLATRHSEPAESADAWLLVDIDLAILGAPAARFDEYELQIRDEYAWVPTPIFCIKRREILATFLARPRIFRTDEFHGRLEARARANLARSLEG